ncbi:right-handed parallel beta-helix repeat-containing protein, partial [Bartonella queenslandensis]|uniref:right-handed parallel beta-helix repeat-containing protein n=1 Tax=Bartonella queenslandensis TaxID=481138 RepID=UPI0031454D7D
MYKKFLLSSMATAAIILLNAQFNVYAESLEVSGEKREINGGPYETLHALKGGQITGTDLKITGNKDTNSSLNTNIYVISTEGKGSAIKLTGDKTTIKGTDSDIRFGLEAKDNAILQMTGGTITVVDTGVYFFNSNSTENSLENVKISFESNTPFDTIMNKGISANNSTVTLNNVTVSQARNAIVADDHSTITISGGSFESANDGVSAKQGSSITLNNTTVTSSQRNGVYADGSDSKIIMIGGSTTTKNEHSFALRTENKGIIDATDVTLTTNGTGTGALAYGEKSKIELHGNTMINNTFNGLGASLGGKITSENLTITGGKAINFNTLEVQSGVWAGESSEINLMGKIIIQNFDEGLYADGGGKITSGDLTIIGGESEEVTVGVNTWETESKIELNGNTTIQNVDLGLSANEDATIKTGNDIKNNIEAKKVALIVINGGHIDLTNLSATAGVSGLQFANFTDNDPLDPSDPEKYHSNEINLNCAIFHIDNDTGIFVGAVVEKSIENSPALSIGTLNLKDSKIHADVLLDDGIFWNKISWPDEKLWDGKEVKEIANGSFTLNADHSTLEGRANIAQERNVRFDLKNGTQWILKNSTQEKDAEGSLLDIAQRSRSDISVLDLENSSLVFKEPTENHYHTLHIGSGKPDTKAVYNATGDAQIYFNTKWTDGTPIAEQETDRLLINGNVSGHTNVLVNLKGNSTQKNISDVEKNVRGLSLIQVSGTAEEDSFKLAHGYTTIGGSPDKYMLRAYGPNSSQGKANIEQSLFDEKDENFWDFRLQPEFLNSNPGSGSNPESGSNPGSGSNPEANVHAPVAQMASYLVMPNALFYSGLTDIAKQNALLANLRTSVVGKQQEKQNGFFLYTYGSTGTLSSENAPHQYGYSGAHLRYAALQGG